MVRVLGIAHVANPGCILRMMPGWARPEGGQCLYFAETRDCPAHYLATVRRELLEEAGGCERIECTSPEVFDLVTRLLAAEEDAPAENSED